MEPKTAATLIERTALDEILAETGLDEGDAWALYAAHPVMCECRLCAALDESADADADG